MFHVKHFPGLIYNRLYERLSNSQITLAYLLNTANKLQKEIVLIEEHTERRTLKVCRYLIDRYHKKYYGNQHNDKEAQQQASRSSEKPAYRAVVTLKLGKLHSIIHCPQHE